MSGPFEMLGGSDGPLCADGVCAVPPDAGTGPRTVPSISAEAPPR